MRPLSQLDASFPLVGHCVDLRLIEPSDADFVFTLRTTKPLSEHLSEVSGTADDQRAWIQRYKAREAEGSEFYFVIQTKSGEACGLVRLYEITPKHFTWGSIILMPDRPRMAALEATVLSMSFGFDTLGCGYAVLDVRRSNHHAIKFYRRLGMDEVGEDDTDLFFEISSSDFAARKPDFVKSIRST